ncbi:MAG: class I SAM-dependent methyltransferase [Thermomicrobiales bacterium]
MTDLGTNEPEPSNPALVAAIREEIAASGERITFARFMELALYHPVHGYYRSPVRRVGRGGDFLTAPEASPFFGMTIIRQIAECWERLGRPARFVVREYGAGVGGLAYDIIAGLSTEAPEIVEALDYRLIEPNRHRLAQALAAMDEVGLRHLISTEEFGVELEPITGVVLANEVADALPVHRLVVRDGELRERFVIWREGWFAEVEDEPTVEARAAFDALLVEGVDLGDRSAVDVSPVAVRWFAGACSCLERGYAVVLDYGYAAKELYQAHRLEGTVRGYYGHTVTDDPYVRVGEQDLTAHVDFTALQRAGESAGMTLAGLTTQGAFLASLGLGDLLVQLQQDPTTSVADYLVAQAAVFRLIDPGGLGRFGVLLMAKNAPVAPPLRGLAVKAPGF